MTAPIPGPEVDQLPAMNALRRVLLETAYNVVFITFFFVTGPFFLWRLWRRGKLLPQFGQRFGFYDRATRARLRDGTDLWIHAVSVGEAMIAQVLIRKLRELRPGLRIAVTTTTATGFAVANGQIRDERTEVLYNPIDFPWSVAAAFNLIRPRRLILVEAEIWPNYLWCARRRRIPVYLVNARLSRRSEERYRRLRALVRPLLRDISLIFAQAPADIARLTLAGFPPETIFNLGSLKYDVAALDNAPGQDIAAWWSAAGWTPQQIVLLGGSTHPGEEEVLLRIYREMKPRWPGLRLVLAPRHAERGSAIRDLAQRLGLRTVTRSQLAGAEKPLANGSAPEVLVVDSTGELRSIYRRATLVFVGKSLRGQGGQNFIEAARVGTPIVVGPNMQNFEVATREFLDHQAILQVADEFELAATLEKLVASEPSRRALGERARATFEAQLNAAERTARVILQSLDRETERN